VHFRNRSQDLKISRLESNFTKSPFSLEKGDFCFAFVTF